MGRILLRAAVLALSLGIFALLLVRAARPPAVTPAVPVPAAPIAAPKAVAPVPAAPKAAAVRVVPSPHIYLGATKADPHLARMLAEEAGQRAGVLRILKESEAPSPAP